MKLDDRIPASIILGILMRQQWIHLLGKICHPLIASFQRESLAQDLPIVQGRENIQQYALLECYGRSLAGVSPYLNSEVPVEEQAFQKKLIDSFRQGLEHGVSETSPDRFNFLAGGQPIVDASFLALGLLRGYEKIWLPLDVAIKKRVVECLKQTRTRKPGFNNWLLFSALIEAFLCKIGESDWDPMRIDYAIRQHEQWYLGDGVYGDGPEFHFDYYNSFVIQPYLLEILKVFQSASQNPWGKFVDSIYERAKRYAAIQERLLYTDGSFPITGRSLAYRSGVFHLLSYMAWRELLPEEIAPAQVRCALTAMIKKFFEGHQNFDTNGFLKVGFNGEQIQMTEGYINHGSVYLALCGFLHLGLPANHIFWTSPDMPWSAVKAWSGQELRNDEHL